MEHFRAHRGAYTLQVRTRNALYLEHVFVVPVRFRFYIIMATLFLGLPFAFQSKYLV